MAKNEQYIMGLDIGTSKVSAAIAERKETGALDVVGIGMAPSSGLRRGVVVNLDTTVESVKQAVEEALADVEPGPRRARANKVAVSASEALQRLARSQVDVSGAIANLVAQLNRADDVAIPAANAIGAGGSIGQADSLVEEGKAIVLVTCTIHSTEVGCTQMAMEFAHDFATTADPAKLRWMDDVLEELFKQGVVEIGESLQ